MKNTLPLLAISLIFIFCFISSLSVKRTSKAVKLTAYFFKALGLKGKLRHIVKRVNLKCPKLRKSSMLIHIINRLNKMSIGIKRMNQRAKGGSSATRRKLRSIRKRASVRILRDIIRRFNHCKASPKKLRKRLRNAIKTMNKVVRGRCRGKTCKLFSTIKIGRLTKVIHHKIAGNSRKSRSTISKRKHKKSKLSRKNRGNSLKAVAEIIGKLLKKLFRYRRVEVFNKKRCKNENDY